MKQPDKLLERFAGCRVLVVGDLMLDDYRRGHVERISPEAPVPILRVVAGETALGGAGNVVKNLRALNVEVDVVGVLGEDETADQVIASLGALGVDSSGVVRDSQRVSTRKIRYVSMEHGQQVFRADQESSHSISGKVENEIIRTLREKARNCQVILCSDYLKGVLSEPVLRASAQLGRELEKPTIVAPKDGNARKYTGANILMPNLKELGRLAGTPVSHGEGLTEAAQKLLLTCRLEALVVTRGSEGMSLFEVLDDRLRRMDIPTIARNVYDVTGAGDTAIATFAAALACGAEKETAAYLANAAAGIVVGKQGTATVTVEELQDHLIEQELNAPRIYQRKRAGELKRTARESSNA